METILRGFSLSLSLSLSLRDRSLFKCQGVGGGAAEISVRHPNFE